MKFDISRVSHCTSRDKKPCEGAVKEGDSWVINIETLDELMAFIEREGDIVLDTISITIYDDYME